MIEASQVVSSILNARNPAQQAWATRRLNAYVDQQRRNGTDPTRTRAAIKAAVTRKQRTPKTRRTS